MNTNNTKIVTEVVCAARRNWQITALVGLGITAGAYAAFQWLGVLGSVVALGLIMGWVISYPAARQGLDQAQRLIEADKTIFHIGLIADVFESCLRSVLGLSVYETIPRWEQCPLPDGFSARVVLNPGQVKTMQENLAADLQSRLAGRVCFNRVEVSPDPTPGMAMVKVFLHDPLAGVRQVSINE